MNNYFSFMEAAHIFLGQETEISSIQFNHIAPCH